LKLLEVQELEVFYGRVKVVSGVSFSVEKGEILGIAGESGSGKSTIANALLRILPESAYIGEKSKVLYYGNSDVGEDLTKLPLPVVEKEVRWKEISMVFQGALNSLNPTLRIRDHFVETAKAHGLKDKDEIMSRASKLLEMVRLDPKRVLSSYPGELSGGMKQRVLIALSLLLNPKLVILDEPTTALDVITQREILEILRKIKADLNLTYIIITHDIALLADFVDRVIVLYAGRIAEEGSILDIFSKPLHPYTVGLLSSVPKIGQFSEPVVIPGSSPDYRRLPPGCKFHPRCPIAIGGICDKQEPYLNSVNSSHMIACHNYKLVEEKGVEIYGR